MPGALQLSLAGLIRISIGADCPIEPPVRKEEVLLAYLALEPGYAHSRERLIGLWTSNGRARTSPR